MAAGDAGPGASAGVVGALCQLGLERAAGVGVKAGARVASGVSLGVIGRWYIQIAWTGLRMLFALHCIRYGSVVGVQDSEWHLRHHFSGGAQGASVLKVHKCLIARSAYCIRCISIHDKLYLHWELNFRLGFPHEVSPYSPCSPTTGPHLCCGTADYRGTLRCVPKFLIIMPRTLEARRTVAVVKSTRLHGHKPKQQGSISRRTDHTARPRNLEKRMHVGIGAGTLGMEYELEGYGCCMAESTRVHDQQTRHGYELTGLAQGQSSPWPSTPLNQKAPSALNQAPGARRSQSGDVHRYTGNARPPHPKKRMHVAVGAGTPGTAWMMNVPNGLAQVGPGWPLGSLVGVTGCGHAAKGKTKCVSKPRCDIRA